ATTGQREGKVPAQAGRRQAPERDALLEHGNRRDARVGHDLRPTGEEGRRYGEREQRAARHVLRVQVPEVGVRPDELAGDPDPELDQRVADLEGVLQRDALEASELRQARAAGASPAEPGAREGAVARGPAGPLRPGRLPDLGLRPLPGRRLEKGA